MPTATRAAFVPTQPPPMITTLPGATPGSRLYRTGHRARRSAQGAMEWLGFGIPEKREETLINLAAIKQ